jgi:hypothetical protein
MTDPEELKRWEASARRDNPSFWSSYTLVSVFDALRAAEKERDRFHEETITLKDALAELRERYEGR